MTAELSSSVQNFVAIWWPGTELQQNELSIKFELWVKSSVKWATAIEGLINSINSLDPGRRGCDFKCVLNISHK